MSGGRIERGIRRRVFGRTPTSVADQQPPPCPAGWRTGPPDFVGVGVQRGGTSWWFRELSRHRDVHQAPGARKELHFFDPFSNRSLTAADIRRYHQWFARPDGGITGEWSPVYVYEPWAVPMLALAAPDARYLLLLRDPIDRFRSGVEFAVRKGFSHSAAVLDAFHRGLYAEQVARLLDHVPRERLLVLLYEELRARPAELRRRTAEFLGLDPDGFDGAVGAREPTARTDPDRGFAPGLVDEIRARYRDDSVALGRLVPDLDLGRWSTASAR